MSFLWQEGVGSFSQGLIFRLSANRKGDSLLIKQADGPLFPTFIFLKTLFILRGEGREKERKRNIDQLPLAQAPTRHQAHNPVSCPLQNQPGDLLFAGPAEPHWGRAFLLPKWGRQVLLTQYCPGELLAAVGLFFISLCNTVARATCDTEHWKCS